MRHWILVGALVLVMIQARTITAAPVRPVDVAIDGERFNITGEGNSVVGLRHAPVPYGSVSDVTAAVQRAEALPTALRLVRRTPPQVIDYVFGITDDGLLVVGQQIRTLDVMSGRYIFTDGEIKRAYPALEASPPWTWIVDIPLGREVDLTLEVRAMVQTWPVRTVAVTPSVR